MKTDPLAVFTFMATAKRDRLPGESLEDAYYRRHAPSRTFATVIAVTARAIEAVRSRLGTGSVRQVAGAKTGYGDRPFKGLAGSQAYRIVSKRAARAS